MQVKTLKNHKKEMIPPIVVTVLMILYYVIYLFFWASMLEGIWKYILGIVPLLFAGVMIYVCIQRINEIKKGEEDDISQY